MLVQFAVGYKVLYFLFIMKRIFNRIFPNIELINREVKQTLPVISCRILQRRGGKSHVGPTGGTPILTHETKEWAHKYYKWNYKRLPTQTSLDVENPQFSIRPPEFKLPKKRGRLSRKVWRQRITEVSAARQDPDLEKLARNRQLMVSIDDIEEEWRNEFGLIDINNLTKFYGINRDLFNNNDVTAETWLDISFDKLKIHRGNMIEPKELRCIPSDVNYTYNNDSLTTLVLSNLDGHPLDSSKEILHWLVCNIPDSMFSKGSTLMEYLPPFPWKGSGFHRLVFTLYKHSNPVGINNDIIGDPNTLHGRTFSSWDFSSSLNMAPIGFAWCQVQWDESVTSTCSLLEDLNGEPVFDLEEYIEPKEELSLLKIQASELKYRNM